jgi:hypothetical protein
MKTPSLRLMLAASLALAWSLRAADQSAPKPNQTPSAVSPPGLTPPTPRLEPQSALLDVTAGDDGHTVIANSSRSQTVLVHVANKSGDRITISHAAFGPPAFFFPLKPIDLGPGAAIDLPIIVDLRLLQLPLTVPLTILAERGGDQERKTVFLTFTSKDLLTFDQPMLAWNVGDAPEAKRLKPTNVPAEHKIASISVSNGSFSATVEEGQIVVKPAETKKAVTGVLAVILEPTDLAPVYVPLAVALPSLKTLPAPGALRPVSPKIEFK